MRKHKLKAFTILELTITTLIAVIVIAITYTSYLIISKSYLSFNTKNDDMTVLVRLDQLLKNDFAHGDMILKDPSGIVIKINTQIIKYDLKPAFVVRSAARVDTFKVQTQEVTAAFENLPINELQTTEEQNRVDELSFSIVYQKEKIPYHYHKLYSAENLIKRNPNAVN